MYVFIDSWVRRGGEGRGGEGVGEMRWDETRSGGGGDFL